jgi:hypothetical protein
VLEHRPSAGDLPLRAAALLQGAGTKKPPGEGRFFKAWAVLAEGLLDLGTSEQDLHTVSLCFISIFSNGLVCHAVVFRFIQCHFIVTPPLPVV